MLCSPKTITQIIRRWPSTGLSIAHRAVGKLVGGQAKKPAVGFDFQIVTANEVRAFEEREILLKKSRAASDETEIEAANRRLKMIAAAMARAAAYRRGETTIWECDNGKFGRKLRRTMSPSARSNLHRAIVAERARRNPIDCGKYVIIHEWQSSPLPCCPARLEDRSAKR